MLWRKHFLSLLQDDGDTNTTFRDVVPNPIDDDDVEISPPSHEVVIMHLDNKAAGPDGLHTELYKSRCNALVGRMHKFIYQK